MKEELEQAFAAIKNGEEEQARVLLARMLKDDPEYVPGWVLLSKLAPNRIQKAAFLEKILALDPGHIYARQEMETLEASPPAEPEVEAAREAVGEAVAAEVAEVDVLAGAGELADVEVPAEAEVALEEEGTVPEDIDSAGVADEEVQPEFYEEVEEIAEPGEGESEPRVVISTEPLDYEAQATGDTLPPWLADDEALLIDELTGEVGDEERMPPEPDLPDWLTEEPAAAWPAEEKPVGGTVRVKEETSVPSRASTKRVSAREQLPPPPAPVATSGLLIVLTVALVIVFLLLIYFGIRLLG